jgi:hypothetical protein
MRTKSSGKFVISLDFELMWGLRDKLGICDYGENVLGVRRVVPALLALFKERDIACTWATVGFLFFSTKRELLDALPTQLPRYQEPRLSPYADISNIGDNENTDPYWYGLSLVKRIIDYPRQEIGTHTFSHFYCLEDGATFEDFHCDLEAARNAAGRLGLALTSIAFPRNQVSAPHLRICRDQGLLAFRGNERVWFHRPCRDCDQTPTMRAFRLADSYLRLAGALDHALTLAEGLVDVTSSRFLRAAQHSPVSEPLRLRRIMSAMEVAARHGTVFHLWWHPHNFGTNLEHNLAFLRKILDWFDMLQNRYGMRSLSMTEAAREFIHVK